MNLLHDINELYFGPQWLKNWTGLIVWLPAIWALYVFAWAVGP